MQNLVVNNNCKMPVFNGWEDKDHFGFNNFNEVNYPWFSDWINTPNYIISPGDILMTIGGLGFIFFIFLGIYINLRLQKIEKNDCN